MEILDGACGTDTQETQMTCVEMNVTDIRRSDAKPSKQFMHAAPVPILMRPLYREVYKARLPARLSLARTENANLG